MEFQEKNTVINTQTVIYRYLDDDKKTSQFRVGKFDLSVP